MFYFFSHFLHVFRSCTKKVCLATLFAFGFTSFDGLPHLLTVPGIWLTPGASSSLVVTLGKVVPGYISIY